MDSRIVWFAVAFLIITPPMVAYMWWVLDEVLKGNLHLVPILVAMLLAVVFFAAVYSLGRLTKRLAER